MKVKRNLQERMLGETDWIKEHTVNEAAERYGRAPSSVRQVIWRNGLEYKKAELSTASKKHLLPDVLACEAEESAEAAARRYGVSQATVYRWRREYGDASRRNRRMTPFMKVPLEELAEEVNREGTFKGVALRYGVSQQRVYQRFKKAGWEMRHIVVKVRED